MSSTVRDLARMLGRACAVNEGESQHIGEGAYHASGGNPPAAFAENGDILLGAGGDDFYAVRIKPRKLFELLEHLFLHRSAAQTLTVDIETDGSFVIDNRKLPGAAVVGRGATMIEAMGDWLINHQKELGIEFELTPAAQPAEDARREALLATR